MSARRIVPGLLALSLTVSGPGLAWAASAPPPPPAASPAPPPGGQTEAGPTETTPPRISYINGQVSFWRPGGQDWAQARLNTPLAAGDVLYTGRSGNVEIQVGPRDFVRAAENTQIGLDNHEPDFIQLRVTAGHAALDLRELGPGHTVELDTPGAAFTVEHTGYYRVDVAEGSTTFRTHRGGAATMTPAGGGSTTVAANEQVVITGADSPQVQTDAAPALTAWDRWNYQRTDYLVQTAKAPYLAPDVYGTEALDQYGSWRTAQTYGAVWVPAGVPAGWVPYSTGRWIWDPRFGWTWLDDAPWGWAPYHYGRWIFANGYWAWAPGPVVVRPAYAPALVVFLGSGPVAVGHPLYWAPLGWGEPVIPWWGRPGFVGVAWWGGWGGPHVVNNVVVSRTTTVSVTNITVYRNVNVTNAVVGVPVERFGQGQLQPTRISQAQVHQLRPMRGAPQVRPVAASMMPASGPVMKPPAAILARPVVATRPPRDVTPALREHGLAEGRAVPLTAPPQLVPPPKRVTAPPGAVTPSGGPNARPGPAASPPTSPEQRRAQAPERPAPAPAAPKVATPRGQDLGPGVGGGPEPNRPTQDAQRAERRTPVHGERPARVGPPPRVEHADGPARNERPARNEQRGDR